MAINSLAHEICGNTFKTIIFKVVEQNIGLDTSFEIALGWKQKRKINIASGNGLVPSGNKPLPEPVLA